MKKLKTISEFELLNAAYDRYLDLWYENKERNETFEKTVGYKSDVYSCREKRYWNICEELRRIILDSEYFKR